MMRPHSPLLVVLFVLVCTAFQAQKTATFYDGHRIYQEAYDLFTKEKYVSAKEKFDKYVSTVPDGQDEMRVNAEYYSGLCALYLLHKDAEYLLEKFVHDHPDSQWKPHVYYELASFNYKKKSYRKSIEWFRHVDERTLSAAQKEEFHYKRGYSYFESDSLAQAKQDFYAIVDGTSEYQKPALYYYSHISYEDGNYETALKGFQALENSPDFKPIVPFYIAQIYYKQAKYDEVIRYTPAVYEASKTTNPKRAPELARTIGDAYFVKEKFSEALPYLEAWLSETPASDVSREDHYQVGYARYRTGKYKEALEEFNSCTSEKDELAQMASYNMGDCYLKLEQKPYARNAFGEASSMDFNRELQEDALFNYAKLAFELSYNPFHEAITAFEDYLEKYPDSPRHDEAYEFLLNVYMKTRNYDAALKSLDKIKDKTPLVKEAYQLVAYNRGVELYQSDDFLQADKYFDKVNTYPVSTVLNAERLFWKAEIAYRKNDYVNALALYNQFLVQPGATSSEYYALGNYGAGYALFKQAGEGEDYSVRIKKYGDAGVAFRKFTDTPGDKDARKLSDAYLRIGDCYYVTKSYGQAVTWYDKAADGGQGMKDYAMFQKALCYGYDKKPDQKIWVLKSLLQNIPDSKYTADVKYELASTYLKENKIAEAKTYYNDILENHANSPYRKQSLVDLCLVYVKEGNEAKVKSTWNTLYTSYPNDRSLKDAYDIVENTLIDDSEFVQQVKNMKILDVSSEQIETSQYNKAAAYYLQENCEQAIQKLSAYLQQYQPALYGVEANYFLAECYFDAGNMDKALESYNFVISKPQSDYTESSLKVAATIQYNRENYRQALENYTELEQRAVQKTNVLEAQIGIMRCSYFLGETAFAVDYAEKVLSNENTPQEYKFLAHLWRGRIRFDQNDLDGASTDFKEVLKKGGENAAEAKYWLAYIRYKKAEYAKAETELFELIEKYSAFNEWKFKGFLLLSDTYVAMKDYFNARSTLNAIIDNVTESWVVEEAQNRLEALDALEGSNGAQNKGQEQIEINIGGNDHE